MPQINRVRVNNVKYNFGTQFYDDFLMRFSCRNSIYDLANGGGKSVLMLLLLQNLIPNCTLDDKQPVEKLFRTGNASTTIHSLIEWKLDAHDVRDGYRYMTTGFCARKGKDNGDENRAQGEAANIEYFNYCIFYKEFGDNDIKNLPLSNGKERITYNGLKAYLRDLDRKDYGVEVHIFDRKGDYQNFISNYGLFESQWEIIRGINKTEGHVRTYFETNYRTTRKVVEDLLIEEIIEKSYNNRIRKDSDDDAQMAKTLLDIKDKLTELARRKDEIGNYDKQVDLLSDFAAELEKYEQLYTKKDELKEALLCCLMACRAELSKRASEKEEAQKRLTDYEAKYETEARLTMAAEIETEYIELAKLSLLIDETLAGQKTLINTRTAIENELRNKEIASAYAEYRDYQRQYDEIKALIAGFGSDKEEISRELSALAAAKYVIADKKRESYEIAINTATKDIEKLSAEYEAAKAAHSDYFAANRAGSAVLEEIEKKIGELSERLMTAISDMSVVSAEAVPEYLNSLKAELSANEASQKFYSDNLAENRAAKERHINDAAAAKVYNDVILNQLYEINELINSATEAEEELTKFRTIYNASTDAVLVEIMESMHKRLLDDISAAEKQLAADEEYLSCVKEGRIPKADSELAMVVDYLRTRYGEDVVTGYELLAGMPKEALAKTLKDCPQMPYIIYADESYEAISNDKVINSLKTGSHIIPILHRNHGNGFGDMVTAFRSMDYLWDEAVNDSELEKTKEDIQRLREQLSKLSDKASLIESDLTLVRRYIKTPSVSALRDELAAVNIKHMEEVAKVDTAMDAIEKCEAAATKAESELLALREKQSDIVNLINRATLAGELAAELDELYARKRTLTKECEETQRAMTVEADKEQHRAEELERARTMQAETLRRLDELNRDLVVNYSPYLMDGVLPVMGLTEEEIDAKAAAYRKILSDQAGNLSDKEALLNTFSREMKKCEQDIRYAGADIVTAAKLFAENGASQVDERIVLKDRIAEVGRKLESVNLTLDSQNAQKNRIEGGIEHARLRYEEKYGEWVRNEIDNPQGYVVSHRNAMSVIKSELLKTQALIKSLEEADKELVFKEKDLARAVKNAGIEITEGVELKLDMSENFDAEAVERKYAELEKEESRLKSSYLDKKQILLTRLEEYKAYELAHEFRDSLTVPLDVFDATRLKAGIDETVECIELERDRVEKSMADMELIKDSFENRCIQICSNIRTELDRLTKLSKITLDEEQISIVSLSVPYIAESLYKDRMSVYINETVAGAETFGSAEDKLRYIRTRLSWKKLFSVIVTDMNSIKLNLYKREHIKDQSRYLKYEEAVGSTGQSQGIYIQFLIAIINYIANINAMGKDGTVTGKTIFIDNPFGAAKDVYIWEPIFKMLKTNHVQLIVPARGTTPAITGMFDVNYILGQKMVGQMQQTVVVDYRSQVQTEEMDYTPLDFTQVTFDFV